MLVKLIAACTHLSSTIYELERDIGRKLQLFPIFFLSFNAPVRSGPWDNHGKCYMDRKRIQCLSNASQHVPIYLQPFLRYSEISVAGFWQFSWANERFFLPHFAFLWVRPWDNRGTWIEREFNACQMPRSMYPSIFNRFWDIARYWSKIAIFSDPTSV